MEEAESFGEQLRRYRKAADLSCQELSRRACISRNSILDLEQGCVGRMAHPGPFGLAWCTRCALASQILLCLPAQAPVHARPVAGTA